MIISHSISYSFYYIKQYFTLYIYDEYCYSRVAISPSPVFLLAGALTFEISAIEHEVLHLIEVIWYYNLSIKLNNGGLTFIINATTPKITITPRLLFRYYQTTMDLSLKTSTSIR